METIPYTKTINENVRIIADVYLPGIGEVNERQGSIVARLVNEHGEEIERKERTFQKGEEFEKFYAGFTDTQYIINIANEMYGITFPEVEDPIITE